ncbi:hypothetical protein [Deinococcus aquiradiocola]|uniref:Uncharacterized protein n=1 Tax=Deinococcus aquiradiocola TaxID=393059 RepID=A0A917PLE4_9DEIO|nr:hypothetical protein [Deinococcus aquiradiocola]GGJ83245.1 hypothetical protein GCM10008939_28900 [Deinococcus aquiradiocola]
MNRSHRVGHRRAGARHALLPLLTLSLLAGVPAPALAQSAAPVVAAAPNAARSVLSLSSYRDMAGSLDRAVRDRPVSSASSLADLDRATAAYAVLKPGLSSSLLTRHLEETLQASRASLSRAPADLEGQVTQARALLRKALYDQTLGQLGAASGGTPPAAQAALLADEFSLQGAGRSAFLKAVSGRDAGSAARLLRSAAAQKVQANLAQANAPQNANDRTATYLSLARASAWFTVVQDAPDSGGLTIPLFTQALQQLTAGDTAGLTGTLSTLKRSAAAFVTASTTAVKTGTAAPASTSTAGTASTAQPATIPATPTQGTATPSASTPATATPATSTPVVASPARVSPQDQQKASLNATYAALSRAQAAAGHANLDEARTQIGTAAVTLVRGGLNSTAGYDTLLSDLNALQSRSGLRASDVQAVIGELSNVEALANARPVSALDATSTAVSRIGTPLWPLLFLIVGLLALYPLYLLNLAFGGRNNYWKAIAVSLLLLVLPVLLEGLGGTLAYLGDLSGVGFLRSLGNLSLHQGAWGLPVWLLLAAVSVGLASYGFRGLCRQFGLLGGSGGSANATRIDGPQPALDWDEEL